MRSRATAFWGCPTAVVGQRCTYCLQCHTQQGRRCVGKTTSMKTSNYFFPITFSVHVNYLSLCTWHRRGSGFFFPFGWPVVSSQHHSCGNSSCEQYLQVSPLVLVRLAPPVINTTSVSLLWLKETKKKSQFAFAESLTVPRSRIISLRVLRKRKESEGGTWGNCRWF